MTTIEALTEQIKDLRAQLKDKEKELRSLENKPDLMASNFKPGVTDMYQFVDYIKSKKYRVPEGQLITIRGESGGLVFVGISGPHHYPNVIDEKVIEAGNAMAQEIVKSVRNDVRKWLTSAKRSHTENCWCEMAIGNPMVKDHDQACKDAQVMWEGLNA